MLERLLIENVALIDRAELEFSEGLNVLSGETGAGKSVILDSIDFVLGAKADKSMIRHGKTECSVQAVFAPPSDPALLGVLSELGADGEEGIILSRRLTAEGKSTIRLNGMLVTASALKRVTGFLVDVHGQSEHFFLLKEQNQLRLLDSVAGAPVSAAKEEVRSLLAGRKRILSDLALLGGDEGERDRRLDILRYQIDELGRAQLREGEEEELAELLTRYRNAEKILSALAGARDCLSADGGGLDSVGSACRNLMGLSKYGDAYDSLSARLDSVAAELEDVSETIESLAEELDIDEEEAERAEARLDEIKTLKKKYGGSVAEAEKFYARAKEEYSLLADSGARYSALQKQLQETDEKLYAACLALTAARKKAAAEFSARVVRELKTLNIASANFEITFGEYGREDVASATAEGLGSVCFLFSANAGEPLKELGKIISGGEMSRFMLAVKAQLSSVGGIGTYLFDEIDAGISGRTARVVAEKFCKIARGTQIVAVSHLAQIASFADRQFLIEKQEEDGRTYTTIRLLEGEERLREIARLVGGETESTYALKHAEELVKTAETFKNSL